jgi:hypothetical protein
MTLPNTSLSAFYCRLQVPPIVDSFPSTDFHGTKRFETVNWQMMHFLSVQLKLTAIGQFHANTFITCKRGSAKHNVKDNHVYPRGYDGS